MGPRQTPPQGVVNFGHPLSDDAGRVGAKAATLSKLRAQGERVPEGMIVLPEADAEVAARLAVDRWGSRPVAVRSSSLAEDTASASYAGQYRTVLDVQGMDAIAEAIAEVRESADHASQRGYGRVESADMAVLLMPMVHAVAAGVAFGANPVTGGEDAIVEAVAGLGESLVSGQVTPQRFTCPPGSTPSEVPGGGSAAISIEQASEVVGLVRRLGTLLGGPQDVEWAIADGQVHLLQSRPITALPVEPAIDLPEPRETWIRADENYAHPVRPLEFTVWAPRLESSFTKVFTEIGAPVETMRYRSIGGWVYSRFIPPMDQGKDDQAAPPAWVFGLLLRLIPPMRKRLRRAAAVWHSELAVQAADDWDDSGREDMRRRTRELRAVGRADLDDEALSAHLAAVLEHLQAASDVHFRLPVLATFLPSGHLGVLSERLLGWSPDQTLRLLQGHSSVTDAADALDEVANAIIADPAATKKLAEDPTSLLHDAGRPGEVLRRHLADYGHRIVGMDFDHKTWAEDPGPVFALIRARLARRMERTAARAEPHADAFEAESEARERLKSRPSDLAEFERALHAARRGVSYGDDTESDVLEALALVRYVGVEAGRRLADRGALTRPDDVWYLTEPELFMALRGEALDVAIERRRAEYLWAKAHRGPVRYGPEPPAWPSMRWVPKDVRPFLEAMTWAIDKMTSSPVEPSSDGSLSGTGASPGRVTGKVRVIRDPSEFDRIEPDDVLVCPCTIAAWSVVFPIVSAIVTEVGGPLSHPGILAREFGIPAVLGVGNATTLLRDGQTVIVDGTAGRVEVLA